MNNGSEKQLNTKIKSPAHETHNFDENHIFFNKMNIFYNSTSPETRWKFALIGPTKTIYLFSIKCIFVVNGKSSETQRKFSLTRSTKIIYHFLIYINGTSKKIQWKAIENFSINYVNGNLPKICSDYSITTLWMFV